MKPDKKPDHIDKNKTAPNSNATEAKAEPGKKPGEEKHTKKPSTEHNR